MIILGINNFGESCFSSPISGIRNITYGELKKGIYDRLDIRERTDISLANIKEPWQIDQRVLFEFINNLEGGNIQNEGLEISAFAIKRRRIDELNDITLGTIPFANNKTIEFIDYTQGIGEYIYSICPVSDQLIGLPNSVQINSEYTGWFLVNKETNDVLAFDKFIDSEPIINTQINQGRVVLETLSRFPNVYYTGLNYTTFTLQTVIVGDEFKNAGQKYQDILDKFVNNHIPMLVKGNGKLYVCDVSQPQTSEPLNTWRNDRDYFILSLNFTEIMDYETYMAGE